LHAIDTTDDNITFIITIIYLFLVIHAHDRSIENPSCKWLYDRAEFT